MPRITLTPEEVALCQRLDKAAKYRRAAARIQANPALTPDEALALEGIRFDKREERR